VGEARKKQTPQEKFNLWALSPGCKGKGLMSKPPIISTPCRMDEWMDDMWIGSIFSFHFVSSLIMVISYVPSIHTQLVSTCLGTNYILEPSPVARNISKKEREEKYLK
jgi:hypothetical protein